MIEVYTFSDVASELFNRGALEGADTFVFCSQCQDVTEAWALDSNICVICGFTVPDQAPRGMQVDVC